MIRTKGMVKLDITVGLERVVTRWVPVVPSHFLQYDVLLGKDVIPISRFTWDAPKDVVEWGKTVYACKAVKKYGVRGQSVKLVLSLTPQDVDIRFPLTNRCRLVIPPHTSTMAQVFIKGVPGEVIMVRPSHSLDILPYCTTISKRQTVAVPLVNESRVNKVVKKGELVGRYGSPIQERDIVRQIEGHRVASQSQFRVKKVNQEISNDLIPTPIRFQNVKGSRIDRLNELIELGIKGGKWSHLPEDVSKRLMQVLRENEKAFILEEGELGKMDIDKVKIAVEDETPVRGRSFRYPERAQTIIADLLEDMREKDVIEPSTSAWLSPIVLVSKPDGSKRMCLDYRGVNTHLTTDIYPLPRLQELVDKASGKCFYSTLDMKEAYFQLELDPDSRDLTTFSDGVSLYRFKRLPFGLNCSPAIFSRQMANILAPKIKKGWVKNYLDDIILWGNTHEEMLERLSEILELFAAKGIKLNLNKCDLGREEVKFLGHIISVKGCKPDPTNVKGVLEMKRPTKVKEVRRFLGMCGFYRKHIDKYAHLAMPLTELTKKDKEFDWTEECQGAFETLKRKLVDAPILVNFNLEETCVLTTDASDTCVGGVLSQRQEDGKMGVIGYFSRKLSRQERKYGASDKEALGIVLSCRQFSHYLWGAAFEIWTDHQPLVSIFKKPTKCARMNRWILEMREFKYRIFYVKGKDNVVADQLSRPVQVVRVVTDTRNYLGLTKEEFRNEQLKDERWKEMIEYLENTAKVPTRLTPRSTLHHFQMSEGVLYYCLETKFGGIDFNMVVPDAYRQKALKVAHEAVGHLGQLKTLRKAEELFYWTNLRTEVIKYVESCLTCQQVKGHGALERPWQELPVVSAPLERVSIDLTDMFSGAGQNRYVLTVIDHYSRFLTLFALKTKSGVEVANKMRDYFSRYGTPKVLLSDNGGEFVNQEMKGLCEVEGIKMVTSAPYHPQGNAVTERVHRTLKTVLATYCQDHPERWPHLLHQTEKCLNLSIHGTTGLQPFFAFHHRHANTRLDGVMPKLRLDEEEVNAVLRTCKETAQKQTRAYLKTKNRGRKDERVEVGQLVWVKRETMQAGHGRKLWLKWVGPYRVVEISDNGSTYTVQNLKKENSFLRRSVGKIKPCVGSEQYLIDEEGVDDSFMDDPEPHELFPDIPMVTDPIPVVHSDRTRGESDKELSQESSDSEELVEDRPMKRIRKTPGYLNDYVCDRV